MKSPFTSMICLGRRLSSALLFAASMAWAQGGQMVLTDGVFSSAATPVMDCPRVTGNLPQTWRDNSCWNVSSRVEYESVISPSKVGKSVRITLKQGLFQLVQPVSLKPDMHLRLGVWMRAQTPMVVKLSLRQSGPPYLEYGARSVRVEDEWTFVEVSAYSNGLWDADSRSALYMITSSSRGTLWVDEAVLVQAPHQLSLPSDFVPSSYFGTHVLHERNVRGGTTESRAGSIRVWDSGAAQWHQIQKRRPRAGTLAYQWDALDERVNWADRGKVDLLMVVGGYAPAWASMPEGEDEHVLPDCHRCDEHPRRISDWRNWVQDLVTRYRGRAIRAWEIWNEPSFPAGHPWCPDQDGCRAGLGSGYRGTPEQLLELQTEAHRIIKKIDPDAWVVTPGVSYHHRGYLDYFLRVGGGKVADAIGYHLYLEGPPELTLPHVLALRGILTDHGLGNKPIWNTESAVSDTPLDVDPAARWAKAKGLPLPRKEDLGPAYLARMYLVGWGAGLGRLYHYAWDDQHAWASSPTQVDRQTNAVRDVNDAGLAFRQVKAWMTGRRVVRMETGQNEGLWRLVLADRKGQESQVLWHPGRPIGAPQAITLPPGMARVCDLTGRCRELGSPELLVDFRPVFLGSSFP
jgi:hypothetical protein